MPKKNGTHKSAEKYVAEQLSIIKKFGTSPKLSSRDYKLLVSKVSRAFAS